MWKDILIKFLLGGSQPQVIEPPKQTIDYSLVIVAIVTLLVVTLLVVTIFKKNKG